MLKAVIFDMDGVIIDSEPMHAQAAILALKKYNIDITIDYLDQYVGSTTTCMCQKIVEEFSMDISPEELLKVNDEMKDLLLKTEGHRVIPYVIELIKNLHKHGMKLIIASSSTSDAIEEVIKALHLVEYFPEYISGSMVSHPKPSPDIFLEAAGRLGVEPKECLVIEDSYHGVTAAKAAGMACIGYINPNSGSQNLSKADILIEGFEEIDYSFVNRIAQYAQGEPATILETKHFVLRELTVSDMEELYRIRQLPEIAQYMEDADDSLALQKEKHKAYITNVYHFYGYGLWGVFLKKSDSLVGRCGIEYKMLHDKEIYELGYMLDTKLQGRGLAKEFVAAVLDYCFTRLEIPCVVAIIDPDNIRSINLAKSVGMVEAGECIRNQKHFMKYEITKV